MNVFERSNIAGIAFRNRILRSATHEGAGGDDGKPLPQFAAYVDKLARGGVGGIITGNIAVSRDGKGYRNMTTLDTDERIEEFRAIAEAGKKHRTPVIAQLSHCSVHCMKKITGTTPVAPSDCRSDISFSRARAMEEGEIHGVINAFADAVVRARAAGFDGVQLHAAHGYLLSLFLSPAVNRRRDRWGGSTENRVRIIKEIVHKAREKVGGYPILVKISAHDGDRSGIAGDEGVRIAEQLQGAGCDAIEASCGGLHDGFNTMRVPKVPSEALLHCAPALMSLPAPVKALAGLVLPVMVKRPKPLFTYNVDIAHRIRNSVDIPVIAVGGIRSLRDIEEIIGQDKSQFVSMSRPFIIEPNIVNKFMEGRQVESRCINCGYCLFGCMSGPLRCFHGKLKRPQG